MEPFAGQRIALLTQHGKEAVISPVLEPALGCRVELVTGYDTDQLGTFTRDIPRPGSQLEAARRKARMGMSLSGLPVGLASEGSFAPDPFTGMFTWNVEMLVLIDDRLGLEVVGMAQGPGHAELLLTDDWAAALAFAQRMGFPAHQLVLRPQHDNDPRMHKGIGDEATLKAVFDQCQGMADDGKVFLESDLRACAHPSRMARIGEAAHDLLQRLQSACPACQAPGFWITTREPGLPCEQCGAPTRQYRAETWRCVRCPHEERRPRTDRQTADAQHCPHCNP
jgi:hypothetical protein